MKNSSVYFGKFYINIFSFSECAWTGINVLCSIDFMWAELKCSVIMVIFVFKPSVTQKWNNNLMPFYIVVIMSCHKLGLLWNLHTHYVHKVLIWFSNFAVNLRIIKQKRSRGSLCMLLMKFSARHIHCYDYISLVFCFLSFTVVWLWMRVVCVTTYESTVFIEFRLILSVTSENNGQQNCFLLVCDKLLKYDVDVKCFSFNVPP